MKRAGKGCKRPRHFTVEFKRRIVEETLSPGASTAGVALQHQLNDNLVFKWRQAYKQGRLGTVSGHPVSLLPVDLVSEAPTESARSESTAGRMELQVGRAHLHIQGCIDVQTLQTVLRCLVR